MIKYPKAESLLATLKKRNASLLNRLEFHQSDQDRRKVWRQIQMVQDLIEELIKDPAAADRIEDENFELKK